MVLYNTVVSKLFPMFLTVSNRIAVLILEAASDPHYRQNSEALDAQNRGAEGRERSQWRLKTEPWRIYRPVVADSHHLDEGQDPDSAWDPH
jgi:hypothetical protein